MRLPRISTVLLSVATILSALNALYWRDRSSWSSQADVDTWVARNQAEVATMDPADYETVYGFAAMTVVHVSDPPHAAAPWFYAVIGSTFETDADGFRLVNTTTGWCKTKAAAWAAVMDAPVGLIEPEEAPGETSDAEPEDTPET